MISFRSGFLTLALALSASASRMAIRDGQASTDDLECKDYLIISSRGTFEKPGPSFVFTGMIKDTLGAVPNGEEVDNPYPASAAPNSPEDGIKWLQTFLTDRNKKCPKEKYALMGYSQGAAVVTLAAAKLTQDPVYENIVAITMVGDPFRAKNRPGNFDEAGGDSNKAVDGKMTSGRPKSMDTYTDANKVLDICFTGDFVCDNDNKSNDPGAHGKYGASKSTQELGAKFLIEKLGGSASGASSSTPASSGSGSDKPGKSGSGSDSPSTPAHAAQGGIAGIGSAQTGSVGTGSTGTGSTETGSPDPNASGTTAPQPSDSGSGAAASAVDPMTPSTAAPSQNPPLGPVKKPHHKHQHKHHHHKHHHEHQHKHHASLDQLKHKPQE